MKVVFYDNTTGGQPVSIVIVFAKFKGKWVVCKHKERTTFECPGGHVEKGENTIEAARRELYEETGAIKFKIVPVCTYSFKMSLDYIIYAELFYADIEFFDKLPNYEIESIAFFPTLELDWTYPDIQCFLNKKIIDFLNCRKHKLNQTISS